jgi:hypothetical protein
VKDLYLALQIGTLAKAIKKINDGKLDAEVLSALDKIIEQTPTRSDYRLYEQLKAIIEMLVAYPKGLSILLGRVSPPTTEQINEMILMFEPAGPEIGVRVEGGKMIPKAERLIYTEQAFSAVIAETGGWPHINEVARGFMKAFPNTWHIVSSHTRWVKTKITRMDGSTMRKVAEINGCSIEGVRNTINSFPLELAKSILNSPLNGKFDMWPLEKHPAV